MGVNWGTCAFAITANVPDDKVSAENIPVPWPPAAEWGCPVPRGLPPQSCPTLLYKWALGSRKASQKCSPWQFPCPVQERRQEHPHSPRARNRPASHCSDNTQFYSQRKIQRSCCTSSEYSSPSWARRALEWNRYCKREQKACAQSSPLKSAVSRYTNSVVPEAFISLQMV